MVFMKVAYVGHFRGTLAMEVSQTRHTQHKVIEKFAVNLARIAAKTNNRIRDVVAGLEAVRSEFQ